MEYNIIKAEIRKLGFFDRLGYYALLAIGTIVIPFLVSGLILPLANLGKDKVIGYTILLGIFITNIFFSQLFIKKTFRTNLIFGGLLGLVICGLTYLISKVDITEQETVSGIVVVTILTWELTYHLLRGRAKT